MKKGDQQSARMIFQRDLHKLFGVTYITESIYKKIYDKSKLLYLFNVTKWLYNLWHKSEWRE
jgi:hypothetical protein